MRPDHEDSFSHLERGIDVLQSLEHDPLLPSIAAEEAVRADHLDEDFAEVPERGACGGVPRRPERGDGVFAGRARAAAQDQTRERAEEAPRGAGEALRHQEHSGAPQEEHQVDQQRCRQPRDGMALEFHRGTIGATGRDPQGRGHEKTP